MAIVRVTDYAGQGNETPIPLGSLTAPGYSDTLQGYHSKYFIIQYTVENIDTDVVVEMRGSIDNVRWFNLDSSDESTTITGKGTYSFIFSGFMPFMKLWFRNENGGTNAVIHVNVYVGAEH